MRRLFLLLTFFPAMALAAPRIGQPAPEFVLRDSQGALHSLSDYRGKIVVLEWISHGCPFVKAHYAAGTMQKLQEEAAGLGAAWFSICSSAPGREGHLAADEAAAQSKRVGSKATAYLLDEDGRVGKAYNAKTTPEIFIINPEGILAYMGGVDNKPTTDPKEISSAEDYVRPALKAVVSGKPVAKPITKPYGCSVKYPVGS